MTPNQVFMTIVARPTFVHASASEEDCNRCGGHLQGKAEATPSPNLKVPANSRRGRHSDGRR